MLKLLQLFALIVLVFLLVAVLVVKKFGLLGLVFIFIALLFGLSILQRLLGKILKRLFLSPFLIKGAVLRDAEVRVRSVTPAPAPREMRVDATDFDGGDTGPRDWYSLDITITPLQTTGELTYWEPGELSLVAPDARPDSINEAGSTLGRVHHVEVWQNGRWHPDDPGKYEGPQRLKLSVAVQPGAHRLRFRYYVEVFGELEIPLELGAA